MFKKIFCNTYVKPFTAVIFIPLYVLVGLYAGFVGGLRETAKATLYACDAMLD